MFLMIGITNGQKDLDYDQTVICSACGRYGHYQVFMTFTQLLLFFIPVFRWNRQYFVRMSCCDTLYSLDPEVGARIARGEDVTIQPGDLYPVNGISGNPSPNGYSSPAENVYGTNVPVNQTGVIDVPKAPAKMHKRCVICGYETEEPFEYCPMCGQRF